MKLECLKKLRVEQTSKSAGVSGITTFNEVFEIPNSHRQAVSLSTNTLKTYYQKRARNPIIPPPIPPYASRQQIEVMNRLAAERAAEVLEAETIYCISSFSGDAVFGGQRFYGRYDETGEYPGRIYGGDGVEIVD